jgi:hypothetical protein
MDYESVTDHGATGDGSTDDTAAIQAAIDTGVQLIYLPPGVYIHTMIELGEGQTLFGSGMYSGTKLKLKNGAADYVATVGLRGLTAKTGITQCCFRDFEYDGNSANNRSWGSGSAAWTPTEYDLIYTQGFYFGSQGGRVPPERVFMHNLYVHDTVRSSIVWGTTKLLADNLHLANSDADHLIYESGFTGSILTNIICEGWSRLSHITVNEGTNLSNVAFRNLTANPTIYDTGVLVGVRAAGSGSACNITNVTIDGMDPDLVASGGNATLFQLIGATNLANVSYTGANTAHTSVLQLIAFSQGQGSYRGYRIAHLNARNLGAKSRLVQVDAYATAISDITIGAVTMAFASVTPAAGEYLFNLQGSVERLTVDDLAVAGTGMNLFAVSAASRTIRSVKFRRVYCESVNGRVATFNSRENIVFEDCDFQGASVTDLTSTSFYDQVFARNVRVGSKLHSATGVSTQNGNAATTVFNIPHGLGQAPTLFHVTPMSAAAGAAHTLAANTTNIVVTFAAAPAAGTGNLVWAWSANAALPPSKF